MQTKKNYTIFWHFAIYVLLFVPAFMLFDGVYDAVNVSKIYSFYLAFSAIAVVYILSTQIFFKKNNTIRFNKIDIAVTVFALYYFIRVLTTEHAYLFSDRNVFMFFLFVLYWFSKDISWRTRITTNPKIYSVLLVVVFFTGITLSLWGLLQLYGLLPQTSTIFKATASYTNPAPLAMTLAAIFPFALGTYLYKEELKLHQHVIYLAIVCGLLILMMLPATHTRTAWIAVLGSSLFLFALKYKIRQHFTKICKTKLQRMVVLGSIVVVCSGLLYGLYSYKKDSADGRLLIWKIASDMVADAPFFGHGPERFAAEYNNYQANWFEDGNGTEHEKLLAGNVKTAYNEVFQLFIELGFVGFLLIMCLIYLILNSFTDNRIIVVKFSVLLSIFILSQFSYPLMVYPITVIIAICLAIVSSANKPIKATLHSNKMMKIVGNFSILALLLTLIYLKGKAFTNYKILYGAIALQNSEQYDKAIKNYDAIYDDFKDNGEYLQYYGKALSLNRDMKNSIMVLEKAKSLVSDPYLYTTLGENYRNIGNNADAEKALLYAANMIPSMFYPQYLLAKMYHESGNIKKAKKTASFLLHTKQVKVNSEAIKEIKEEMQKILNINEN